MKRSVHYSKATGLFFFLSLVLAGPVFSQHNLTSRQAASVELKRAGEKITQATQTLQSRQVTDPRVLRRCKEARVQQESFSASSAFVVTDASDAPDADLTDNTYSPQTLRSAIQNANKLGGSHVISFAGAMTISPLSALPDCNFALSMNGGGVVTLDGSAIPYMPSQTNAGLLLSGNGSVVKNIKIQNFPGPGLQISSDNNVIQGNIIRYNSIGINTNGMTGTLFGGNTSPESNYIYGTRQLSGSTTTPRGMSLISASHDNMIIGNYIGVNENDSMVGNEGAGIAAESSGLIIEFNQISGNGGTGIELGYYFGTVGYNVIRNNTIGLNYDGNNSMPNGTGISISFSSNDSIYNNLVSGNTGNGIYIGQDAKNTVVQFNDVGVDLLLTKAIPNNNGIYANRDLLSKIHSNLIVGNTGAGIYLYSDTASVTGNYVGVLPDGITAIPNGIGVHLDGNGGCTIGGPLGSGLGNLISGNKGDGMRILTFSENPNLVYGNLIGTDVNGTDSVPNEGNGILIGQYSANNVVEANVISGNRKNGIFFHPLYFNQQPYNNIIRNNLIGTDITGGNALSNKMNGIMISRSFGNRIGSELPGVPGNTISGNELSGIRIDSTATGNYVLKNYIGTDSSGHAKLGNGECGILIDSATYNGIGGYGLNQHGNVISGNSEDGIRVINGSRGTVISANRIGLAKDGVTAIGNGEDGIYLRDAQFVQIGGAHPDSMNVISGNDDNGIDIHGTKSDSNKVIGNYIGISLSGDSIVPNESNGIRIYEGDNNQIGDTLPGTRNVISGNENAGILLAFDAEENRIVGNIIGLNPPGNFPMPNTDGIRLIEADENMIGGSLNAEGNIIAGNKSAGIVLANNSDENSITNNLIGTYDAVYGALGNETGIEIKTNSGDNLIGRTGGEERNYNYITYNKLNGIRIDSGCFENTISKSAIYDNGKLGIDLNNDGVSANDAFDKDDGANGTLNFPRILLAFKSGANLNVSGIYEGRPNDEDIIIQVFESFYCDSTGYGEGADYKSKTMITTSEKGIRYFNLSFPSSAIPGDFVTATATDDETNTSEFGKCRPITVKQDYADLAVEITDTLIQADKGDTLNYLITLANYGPFTGDTIILKDTLPAGLTFISAQLSDSVPGIASPGSNDTCIFANGILTCTLDSMQSQDTMYVMLKAKTTADLKVINNITVSTGSEDYFTENNSAADTTKVGNVGVHFTGENQVSMHYFPSPAKDQLTIEVQSPGMLTGGFIQLRDVKGRIAIQKNLGTLPAGKAIINFSIRELPSGVYLVVFDADNGTRRMVRKLVVLE